MKYEKQKSRAVKESRKTPKAAPLGRLLAFFGGLHPPQSAINNRPTHKPVGRGLAPAAIRDMQPTNAQTRRGWRPRQPASPMCNQPTHKPVGRLSSLREHVDTPFHGGHGACSRRHPRSTIRLRAFFFCVKAFAGVRGCFWQKHPLNVAARLIPSREIF